MALFSFPLGCAGQRPGMGRHRFGGETRSPEINFNNDYGDPVRHLQLQGEDTSVNTEYIYVYDRNGNWTRTQREYVY
jgi:hypothetical protein